MIAKTQASVADHDEWTRCLFSRDIHALIGLIEAGRAVDYRPGHASTPLHCAARYGLTEMVEVLLAYHAPPNGRDTWGRTPLHSAAAGGHVQVIARLMAAGADIDARECVLGMTPLHLAARHGHAEALWHLLWYGADHERLDALGDTALTLARRVQVREVIAYRRTPLPVRSAAPRGRPHRRKP